MYHADFFAPPRRASMLLEQLNGDDSSIVIQYVGPNRKQVVRLHPWPSWLTRGSPTIVDFFLQFFYLSDVTDFEKAPGTCPICQKQTVEPFWSHAFYSCRQLHTISNDAKWQSFCKICYGGDSAIAMYACLPLFFKYHKLILQQGQH